MPILFLTKLMDEVSRLEGVIGKLCDESAKSAKRVLRIAKIPSEHLKSKKAKK
jgi:hypothetical protein